MVRYYCIALVLDYRVRYILLDYCCGAVVALVEFRERLFGKLRARGTFDLD